MADDPLGLVTIPALLEVYQHLKITVYYDYDYIMI